MATKCSTMSSANPYEPPVSYLSSTPYGDIIPDQGKLDSPLPLCLSDLQISGKESDPNRLTYGWYFKMLKDFLSRNAYQTLIDTLKRKTGEEIRLPDIKSISIRTEKHGAMYHIASVDVATRSRIIKLVITVALSKVGKFYLENDFYWLNYLNKKFSFSYLPQVYHIDQITYPAPQDSNCTLLISLGEWLQGYYEFHLSIDPTDQKQKNIVWDLDSGYRYLSEAQSYNLYRQAARILTLYYDMDTFHQISLWHHAAGDFVVRIDGEDIDLKLVTVRGYEPLIAFSTKEDSNKIAALLHFFLHLSIRMRIDRFDGVGDVAWADDFCLEAVMKGFYEALEIKEKGNHLASHQKVELLTALKQFKPYDWSDMAHAALKTCSQPGADLPIIADNLDKHIKRLYELIQDLKPSPSLGHIDRSD